MRSRSALPPGPQLPAALQMVGFWTRPLSFLEQCRERYGKRFTVQLPFSPPFVMVTEPEQVKQVFQAPPDVLRPGEGALVLEPIIGSNSVILLDEGAHMAQRKLMLPAFHGERMERLTGLIEEVAAEEVAALPKDVPVALHPRMQDLTLKVILRAVFGLEPGPRFEALRQRLAKMLEFGDKPLSLVPPKPDSLVAKAAERVGPFVRFVRMQEEVDEILFALIAERRAEHGGDDILAMLVEARHEDGSPMSDQEIRDELITLLVAGHETTASSLAWAFSRLVHEPRVLDRLVEEIDAGEEAYVTATIQETMRARPVLPNVAPRLVAKPIEVGDWTFEPGSCSLVCNGYLIHHDPDIYPDPYSFRPERFLEEPPGTYTWIPFGGGRRRCIGASFAMLEMKIVLRELLTTRELSAADGAVELAQRRNITVRPAGGATVTLGERSRVPALA